MRRSRACTRSRRTDSDNGCAAACALPDMSPKDRTTLPRAVAGIVLIAGRVLRNSRLAGEIALVPRDLTLCPRVRGGGPWVECREPEQRNQAGGAGPSGEK